MSEMKRNSSKKTSFVKIMAWILAILMVGGSATTALILILQYIGG